MDNAMDLKRESISVFFPCYNDKGTIATMVIEAKAVLDRLGVEYEIIVIEDGSSDGSQEVLAELEKEIDNFKVIYHGVNRGYGEALRSGFSAATKDLVFYTDGDAQYDVKELPNLLEKLTPEVDIVNGFKLKRSDPFHRIIIGYTYQYVIRWAFWLPIKDPDCDFRLMRKKIFDQVKLNRNDGTVCIELVKKFDRAGFKFVEVGVHHYFRTYGKSQFFNFKRIRRTVVSLISLWFELMVFRKKIADDK